MSGKVVSKSLVSQCRAMSLKEMNAYSRITGTSCIDSARRRGTMQVVVYIV